MKSGIDVGEIMNVKVVTVTADTTIEKVARLANKYRIGGLPVIDKNRKLVGIVTERDVMRKVVALNKKPASVKVKDIMTSPPEMFVAKPNDDMNWVAKQMAKHDITRVPIVTDNGMLVGVVTNKDMMENCPRLIDVLLEQAKVKGPDDVDPIAIGPCDRCGNKGSLSYKEGEFLCEECISKLK